MIIKDEIYPRRPLTDIVHDVEQRHDRREMAETGLHRAARAAAHKIFETTKIRCYAAATRESELNRIAAIIYAAVRDAREL